MTLVRWDPFRELMNVHDRLNQLFSDSSARGQDDLYGNWNPAVDIFEQGDDLILRAEVPGVQRENLNIQVEDGTLVLSGERRRESEVREENAYRLERSYGKFSRSFRLPATVDPARITAQYRDGVLEVRLPKLEEARPRKIQIQAS
jgi:HSP20 family protein